MVADYSALYGEIAVTVGPVFNDDATALWRGRTNRTRYPEQSLGWWVRMEKELWS